MDSNLGWLHPLLCLMQQNRHPEDFFLVTQTKSTIWNFPLLQRSTWSRKCKDSLLVGRPQAGCWVTPGSQDSITKAL